MRESVRLIGLVVRALGFAACGYPPLPQLDDGGVTTSDHLTLSFADFKLSQHQTVRLHVQLVHRDGTMRDVTAEAMYTSDNPTIATSSGRVWSTAVRRLGPRRSQPALVPRHRRR